MARSVSPCVVLALCVALAVPAVPAAAGPAVHGAQTRRKPPVTETERVTTSVVPGLLLVSVPAPRRFRDDGRVHDTEPLQVVVRDSRPGTPGWSLGGIARNFAEQGGTPSRSETIRWTPVLVSGPPGGVTVIESGLGEPIEEDPGSASRPLASAKSLGTTVLAIGLGVPLSAREARFTGEVTFTVL